LGFFFFFSFFSPNISGGISVENSYIVVIFCAGLAKELMAKNI